MALALGLGFAQRRKEHPGQNRNDRYHDQQFDQGEASHPRPAATGGLKFHLTCASLGATHRITSLPLADTSVSPSGKNDTQSTPDPCPLRVNSSCPNSTSQSLT